MKTTARLRSALAVTALACASFTSSASAQLVNGGFESGNFSGWTQVEPFSPPLSNVGSNPAFAYAGTTYHANLTADSGFTGTLSQTFNTDANSLYNVTFALANDVGTGINSFEMLWNNTVVFSVSNAAVFNYTLFSVNNLTATGSDTIQFRVRHDEDFFRLDEVTVGVVPEPSTISFAVVGLGLFGAISYRRVKLRRSSAR
ncbi:MAG TPA: PEP-CTERM sorting domain-containing protein [Chthoniobacterales bacterium]